MTNQNTRQKTNKIPLTKNQLETFNEFKNAVEVVTSTVPSVLFLSKSRNHKNYDVMFLEDEKNIVLNARSEFNDICFPTPVNSAEIVYDYEWENPRPEGVDWKIGCKTYMTFYMLALANNLYFVNKWVGEADYTIKSIENRYDFNSIIESKTSIIEDRLN